MARRTKRYKRKTRRYKRRGGKLRRIVVALSRKMAAEVKKVDNNTLVSSPVFTQLSSGAANTGLADFGLLYQVFGNAGMVQGIELDDFIGEQIRGKYLYLGLHLQSITSNFYQGTAGAINMPVTLRVMVVQDRNYNVLSANADTGTLPVINDIRSMVFNLFGVGYEIVGTGPYVNNADLTLLPLNPQEPGRFNVIRDFRMSISPGWRNDYYKKLLIHQKELNSKGRIYFGTNSAVANIPPGDSANTSRFVSRNNIYVLCFFQTPFNIPSDVSAGTVVPPYFNLSIQTRFAFYDN